jgi:hypothetical protein
MIKKIPNSGGLLASFTLHPASVEPAESGNPAVKVGQVAGQVESWVHDVLQACLNQPRTSAEIQRITGIRHRETFQCNDLDRLLSEEILERTF